MTKRATPHRTTTTLGSSDYRPEVARAAAIQRARGPRHTKVGHALRTLRASVEHAEIGASVPYRDLPR